MHGKPATPFIEFSGVRKGYRIGQDGISIFADLNLSIPRGEFVAIMGPSGSGKSTLLNMLGGIDRPDQGQIRIGEFRLDRMGDNALAAWRADNVGIVFQFYNLLPILTAAQNIELPLLLKDLTPSERRVRTATVMELVGLRERHRQMPGQMSGGQQQRVGIARAIVADPALLLCDEPTGDLDRQSADEILQMLGFLNRELGKTIIMVTHDPEAARHATRTLHLNKGQFIETGEMVQ